MHFDACRFGDPELTITAPARVATMVNGLAPGLVVRLMMIAAKLLPGPAGPEGDQPRRGRDSESAWAPSLATTLTDRAAVLNNEA